MTHRICRPTSAANSLYWLWVHMLCSLYGFGSPSVNLDRSPEHPWALDLVALSSLKLLCSIKPRSLLLIPIVKRVMEKSTKHVSMVSCILALSDRSLILTFFDAKQNIFYWRQTIMGNVFSVTGSMSNSGCVGVRQRKRK